MNRQQATGNRQKMRMHFPNAFCLLPSACSKRGFTLVEMIVAVALFAMVMTISVGALLSLTSANRKAQALQAVINNLNVAIDGMVRSIRMGTTYHCGGGTFTLTQDCANGDPSADNPNGTATFAFKPFCNSEPCDSTNRWVYSYDPVQERIYKSVNNGLTPLPLTAQEVKIESMRFYVVGTDRGCGVTPCDTTQPKVVITISGTAGAVNVKTTTSFNLQATAVQRVLDL
ncbi:MAG: type II secretion system GspH family protein [Candidatus Kaiserbacteria bacterium]|nr:type II secretion system GspH family protein [Candidatus Kaiserbacteria bacterium]